MKMSTTLFYFVFCINLSSLAQEGYPTPATKASSLFYIQHSAGHNTYVYEANLDKEKKIRQKDPINNYRILYDNDGEIKPLTSLQQKFAYGIRSKRLAENNFELQIVAYKELPLYLKMTTAGKPFVETTVNNQKFNLQRIYIKQKDGTSGLGTKIEYLLFFGIDSAGNKVSEKLIP